MKDNDGIIKNTVRTPTDLDNELNECAKAMNYSKNTLFLIGAKLVLKWAQTESLQPGEAV